MWFAKNHAPLHGLARRRAQSAPARPAGHGSGFRVRSSVAEATGAATCPGAPRGLQGAAGPLLERQAARARQAETRVQPSTPESGPEPCASGKSAGGATGMRMQASSSAAQRPGAVLHRRRQSWSRADRAFAASASRCGRAPIFGGVRPMQSSRALLQGTPVSPSPPERPTINISI